MCFDFLYKFCPKHFLILRRIQRDIIINVHRPSCKVPLFLSDFNENLIFSTECRKKGQISNFMKIRPVEGELFHLDGQTDRHDEANSSCPQFCGRAEKLLVGEQLKSTTCM